MITTLTSIVNTLCTTGNKDFPANFKITDQAYVYVYYIDGDDSVPEELLTQVTAFTAGVDNEYKIDSISETGFNVELRDAYTTFTGRKISIRRIVPLTQAVDYPPGNDFPAATHERALDKLTAIVQQFEERIIRQIGVPLSEDASITSLLMPAYIPNYYLGLDGSNNLIWKVGTVAVGNDEIKDTHIDWGTDANQVSAVDMPIADAGGIITATDVEGALQENMTSINTNTTNINTNKTTINTNTRGLANISISNYDNDLAPAVKVGSIFDNNGSTIEVITDATPTGYSGITVSTTFYLYWDESAGVFIYSNTTPVWSDALQGWYNGDDRAFFSMYKDSGGTLYQSKSKLVNSMMLQTKVIEIGSWDMDAVSVVTIPHGVSNPSDIINIDIVINPDPLTSLSPVIPLNYSDLLSYDSGSYLVDPTNNSLLILERRSSGVFDSINFDDTSINRGWITIQYIG